ncbi:hypothetical protein PIB30_008173 [Stylosanthes scabra]|uniref:Uncharacterized protein n=1 Tax=Stylosanthes scabra TaxID=79078 RepID=A0ABU6Z6Q2_9FABA|nr:hypothetical protein [Stylosanthes scabra]
MQFETLSTGDGCCKMCIWFLLLPAGLDGETGRITHPIWIVLISFGGDEIQFWSRFVACFNLAIE